MFSYQPIAKYCWPLERPSHLFLGPELATAERFFCTNPVRSHWPDYGREIGNRTIRFKELHPVVEAISMLDFYPFYVTATRLPLNDQIWNQRFLRR